MRLMSGLAALGAAVLLCTAQSPARSSIQYQLTPIVQAGALRAVQVDLRFRGEADGETGLRLPSSWGGRDELWRSIDALSVVSGGTIAQGEGPAQRILTHRPNARIHVRYRIIQDFEGAPNAEQGNAYRPVIQPNYFHFIGEAGFVTPDGEAYDRNTPVRVAIRNLPRGWTFASDLQHAPLTLGRVWSSVTVGGDFRVLDRPEQNVRVAIRGDWRFTDDAFADEAASIVAGHRRFFGDPPSPYLITVIQQTAPRPGWLSIGGTGLADAFAFFATPNAEAAQVTRTLAHEGIHTWIPLHIGGMTPGDAEREDYWLSEGFTDFYTARILVRDGLWTPAQFAADLNETLNAYAQSPVRTAPNARIRSDFWSDQNVQRLPYQRGRLLAMRWDQMLRARGRDFDDVILAMRDRARAGEAGVARDHFIHVMNDFGIDVRVDLAAYVERGDAVLLADDALAPCGRIETHEGSSTQRLVLSDHLVDNALAQCLSVLGGA
jgi:predicted metalloprotease with PDZ domain